MTMLRITGRLLGSGLVGLVALLIGVVLFEAVQAPVVDSFGGAQGLSSLIDSLPPALQVLARAQRGFTTFASLAGALSAGFSHPLYIVLTLAAIVGFAARSLAGEMERGTIQIALARPVSRPEAYGARVLGLVLIALCLALVGTLGLVLGIQIARPEGELLFRNLVLLSANAGLLFWAIGGLSLAVSAAASATGRVIGWIIGYVALAYFVDYFAEIWAVLKPLTFLSIFNYFDPTLALAGGELPWRNAVVLGLTGLAGVGAGLLVFVRRDLPT